MRDVLKGLFPDLEPAERQKKLETMRQLLSELQAKANFWHLRPAWQMTSALELLVTRAIEKPKDATPSVIRTIASALDTLQQVCVPGIRPNLLLEPPIKVLAVDDEPLCRRALQFALHKASLGADLAEGGEQAIQLAEHFSYDVVLMDIQMSGIDGLAACRRILQTQRNSDVPVIFVTVQTDFDTRTKTRLEGGVDIMAKPYLILELTVKAVTFAMRKRLQVAGRSRSESLVSKTTTSVVQVFAKDLPVLLRETSVAPQDVATEPAAPSTVQALEHCELDGDFFMEAPKYLAATQRIIDEIGRETDATDVRSRMGEVYLRIHKVATRAALLKLVVTGQIISKLEALVKRLYNNPKAITVSTIHTVSSALKLLNRICVPNLERRLADHPPVHILVAEDEALARRAIVGALQLAFEKPDSTDDGAKALLLAAEIPYDVIFTDVQMPEMDGFAFCKELRARGPNQNTPVVFITGFNNIEAQAQALESGGNDFIGKPFLPIEIAVKAMTFAWEGRLRKLTKHSSLQPLPIDRRLVVSSSSLDSAPVAVEA